MRQTATETDGLVRPSTAPLHRAILISALALTLLPTLSDDIGLMVFPLFLGIVVVLLGTGLVIVFRRNTRLEQRGDDLVHTNWRRREQAVPARDIATAGFVPILSPGGAAPQERLVVERHSDASPLVVGVGGWDRSAIHGLLAGLGAEVRYDPTPVSRRQLWDGLPSYHPSFVDRHPMLVGMGIAVVVIAAIAAATVAVAFAV